MKHRFIYIERFIYFILMGFEKKEIMEKQLRDWFDLLDLTLNLNFFSTDYKSSVFLEEKLESYFLDYGIPFNLSNYLFLPKGGCFRNF